MITRFRGKYNFLSNFHPVKIEYDGIIYPSVEHAYQAMKTTDEDLRIKISKLETPTEAKQMGKKVKIRDDWGEMKIPIMKDLLTLKFNQHDLKEKLLSTGDELLIEGNDWGDDYWGMCNGRGYNMLGVLLTYIRFCNQ